MCKFILSSIRFLPVGFFDEPYCIDLVTSKPILAAALFFRIALDTTAPVILKPFELAYLKGEVSW